MIEELLHTGIQNALSPEYLAAVTGLDSVGAVQKQIERERRSGAVILSSTVPPGGYYLPANRSEVMGFIRTLENRSLGTMKKHYRAQENICSSSRSKSEQKGSRTGSSTGRTIEKNI